MRYRIKVIRYANGRTTYTAQVKRLIGWTGILIDGSTGMDVELEDRERALYRIDLHYKGNSKIQKIEFEYITK